MTGTRPDAGALATASTVLASAVIAIALLASTAHAAAKTGKITAVYADPGDFVVELDTPGDCGSRFYHIQRSRQNFKEVVALFLTAYSAGKRLIVFVESCAGDRNILTHAGSFN